MHRTTVVAVRRAVVLAAAVALLAGVPAAAEPAAPSAAPKPSAAGAGDPARSGAALNRDAAVASRGAPRQGAAASALGLTDPTTIVNDPTADTTARDTQSETSIVAVGSNVVVAFNDSGSFTGSNNQFTGWSVSTDQGNSFTDRGALPPSPGGDAGDPVLAADQASGRIYLATLEFNSLANIQMFRSDTGGQTFMPPVNATPGMPAGSQQDKEWIAVDNFPGPCQGNVYVGWRQFGGTNEGMQFTRSVDQGNSWGPAGGLDIVLGTSQGAYVTVGPDHSVYFFWLGAGNAINVRRSTDCGATFGPPVLVADVLSVGTNGDLGLNGGFRSNAFPHAAVHPVTGAVFVVYNDDPAGPDRSDVLYVSSTDGGATWSPPQRMNADPPGNDQFFPTIAFTGNGKAVMVAWYDRRNDPSNLAMQRYGRIGKAQGGALVLNEEFAMSPAFPPAIAQDPAINSIYMGDYDQIAAVGPAFVAPFADNRDGNSFHANQPDVRYVKVPAKGRADVRLTLADTPDPVAQGGNVTLTATVRNQSTAGTAQVVFATVNLPPGLVAQSATSSAGTCYTGPSVTCRLGRLQPGVARTITIQAFAAGTGTLTTTASVTTGTKDPDQPDNHASVTTTVNGGASTVTNASTGNIATPVPDVTTTEVPINVSVPSGRVLDVNVGFRLNHTFDGDLLISLVSPDGTTVLLSGRRGGSGDNFGTGALDCTGVPTTLDDSAAAPVSSGAAPFAGTFRPDGLLSGLQGDLVNGTWKLRIADLAGGDVGTVGCVTLAITRTT